MHKVGIFFFKPVKGSRYWQKLEMRIKYWPEITKFAISENRPFTCEVTAEAGLRRLLQQSNLNPAFYR